MKYLLIIFVLLAFLSGLYVYSNRILDQEFISPIATRTNPTIKEGLQPINEKTAKCPNILVKSGEYLLLYNTTDSHDEMPVMFNNLDEYANYIRKQRENGIRCPVLFLQKENNAQGQDVFKIRSTPFNDLYNEPFQDYVGMTIQPSSVDGVLKFPPAVVTQLTTNAASGYPFFNIEAFEGGMGTPASFPSNTPPKPPTSSAPIMVEKQTPVSNQPSAEGDDLRTFGSPASIPNPDVRRSSGVASKPFLTGSTAFDKDMYPGFDAYGQNIGKYTNLDKIHDSTMKDQLSDNPMDPNWGGIEYTKAAVDSGKYIENNVYPVNFSMPGSVQFYPGLYKTYPDPPNFVKKVGGETPPFLH